MERAPDAFAEKTLACGSARSEQDTGAARRAAFCANVFDVMVRLYGEPGIASWCLEAQTHHAVDVPSLLFFALADSDGHGADDRDMQWLLERAGEWRSLFVLPLRHLRLTLRQGPRNTAEIEFYEKIKAAELEAERLQVRRLADDFLPLEGPGGLAARYLETISMPEPEAGTLVGRLRAAAKAMCHGFPIMRTEDLKTS
ncbi:TIGR02444 family protein [Rhizobium leguminosarum bv. trifolii]|uniref:TIGR02444 family protein n=1 Tax=Rhizobium ruizarguesonis TaxID=2081791 RepID=A0AAE4YPL8_9HYPH|nr:TIGR02444 family protein [Rhizobium ruizarguesonis]MBY5804277.1 TIGR02444 family protein [Rhizobium leguminosarum]NKL13026.1 TIGR02444 family protein [Rhizobium leguminosarum bv. viciae]QIO45980.1 TIGR02444 family protein [Rhizobium leguminosarum bv. trifolii]MBY5844916.1 TIGR02444 family protein [Rhizobium leguminosarum]MBY5881647.1 TIGR02444 family protein [Rhizobium leguminosarum]